MPPKGGSERSELTPCIIYAHGIMFFLFYLFIVCRFSKDNMLLAGLWFSREKPTMTTYMHPLMKELNHLSRQGKEPSHIYTSCFIHIYNIGISVTSPDGVVISKAKLLMCSVDLPARALVLNMKQYNGKFACAYCENEGTPRATSALHRNWLYSSDYVLRTHDSVISNAEEATVEGDAVCF